MTRLHSEILRDMQAIEQTQSRPLRSLAIDPDDAVAKQRLIETETRIAALRVELAAALEAPGEG